MSDPQKHDLTVPECSTHGDQVLSLLLGRLDDDESVVAEAAIRDCPSCRTWYRSAFDPEVLDDVRSGVEAAVAVFEAPAREPSRRRVWMTVAAGVVAVVGLPLAFRPEVEVVVPPETVGEPVDVVLPNTDSVPSSDRAIDALFADGFESGTVDAWTEEDSG